MRDMDINKYILWLNINVNNVYIIINMKINIIVNHQYVKNPQIITEDLCSEYIYNNKQCQYCHRIFKNYNF